MENYENRNNNSGIKRYECGDDFIRVRFSNGTQYLYTWKSTGKENIEQMKKLAKAGSGLNTFINIHVRNNFENKER